MGGREGRRGGLEEGDAPPHAARGALLQKLAKRGRGGSKKEEVNPLTSRKRRVDSTQKNNTSEGGGVKRTLPKTGNF